MLSVRKRCDRVQPDQSTIARNSAALIYFADLNVEYFYFLFLGEGGGGNIEPVYCLERT